MDLTDTGGSGRGHEGGGEMGGKDFLDIIRGGGSLYIIIIKVIDKCYADTTEKGLP